MSAHPISLTHIYRVATLVLFMGGLTALSGNSDSAAAQGRRHTIEKFASSDVPLKIVRVDNLQSANFPSDLEIEVKNVSSKPIFYIRLGVFFPEVLGDNGNSSVITLRYGNPKLINIKNRPHPEDIPIRPGGSHVFKVPAEQADGFKKFVRTRNLPVDKILSISLRIDTINFGDNTGFTSGGLPYPNRASRTYHPLEGRRKEVVSMKIGFMPARPKASVSLLRACQNCQGFNCGRYRIESDPNDGHFCTGAGGVICEVDIAVEDPEVICQRRETHQGWCTDLTPCFNEFLNPTC